eukprot:8319424-Pyramimonas_sp.AAC.1
MSRFTSLHDHLRRPFRHSPLTSATAAATFARKPPASHSCAASWQISRSPDLSKGALAPALQKPCAASTCNCRLPSTETIKSAHSEDASAARVFRTPSAAQALRFRGQCTSVSRAGSSPCPQAAQLRLPLRRERSTRRRAAGRVSAQRPLCADD